MRKNGTAAGGLALLAFAAMALAAPENWRVVTEDAQGRPTSMEFNNKYAIVREDVTMQVDPVRMVPAGGTVLVSGAVQFEISEGQKALFWNHRGGLEVFWRHLEQKNLVTAVTADADHEYVKQIMGKVVRVTRKNGIHSFGVVEAVKGGTGQHFNLNRSRPPLYNFKGPAHMTFHRDGIQSISVLR